MMKYPEMKTKVLALIEELNPDSEALTDDPDISAKYIHSANHVMFELVRMKKLARYIEAPVVEGQLLTFGDIGEKVGRTVYQLDQVRGIEYEMKANGTVIKARSSGIAEIECFVYPQRITEENQNDYEYELSDDVLEIMPYGIAADLLKSDKSAEYGSVYASEFERKLARLDPRNALGSFYIEGGVRI